MNRLFMVGMAITFVACQKDEVPFQNTLDKQIEQLLVDASPNQSMDYFRMPASTAFDQIPQDPQNPLTVEKVALGQMLFHETGLALAPKHELGRGTYSCASCHFAGAGFQAGRQQGIGDGGTGFGANGEARKHWVIYAENDIDVQPIRTPSAMNGAYQELQLWNGQFGATGGNVGTERSWTPGTPKETNLLGYQGLETQAIAGLSVHRMRIQEILLDEMGYRTMFDEAFPDIPASMRYTKEFAGLAIAAYERTILANQAPFQKWLNGDKNALNTKQKMGAMLFFGKAGCVNCHTGPALNQMDFYALGMQDLHEAVYTVHNANFDNVENLGRGGFTQKNEDLFKFKVPQLYNLKDSPFFGHGSSFTTVRGVIEYKNNAVAESTRVPVKQLADEFVPLGLSDEEIDELTAFVEEGLRDFFLQRYEPAKVLSGSCFPNSDPDSKSDLGCE